MRIFQRSATFLLFSILLQAEVFSNVRYLYKAEGDDKGQEVVGNLNIDASAKKLVFQSPAPKKRKRNSPPDVTIEVKANSITSALYERASRPRYVPALLIAWPLIFTKGKKHFLTMQYNGDSGEGRYVIFNLDKTNFRAILGAVEAATGKKVERSEEH